MTKKVLAFALMVVLCVSAFALVGCSKDDSKNDSSNGGSSDYKLVTDGKLTVASDCDYPPFIQLNADGNPEGFEYDMMKAIAQDMGLEVEYLPPQAFDTIIPTLKAGGKMDVGVSSFTITPEREEEVDFSNSYFEDGVNQAITIKNDSAVTTKDDLAGKKIGVQAGTTGGQWAEENLTSSEVVPFTTITDAFNAMMSGKVDACVCDLPTAENMISKSFTNVKVLESVPTAEEYGIAVSKDNPDLTKAINDALKKLQDNGTMDELEQKWLSDL